MKKSSASHHLSLSTNPLKRLEMVVAACISIGYVNREVLASYYNLHPLQASILLREFLRHHIKDIRRDVTHNGYALVGYPSQTTEKNKHSEAH